MFNESIEKDFTLAFDSWTTDRKTVDTGREYQLDIGSSSNINSAKISNRAHQTQGRAGPSNKANKIAILEQVKVRK